MFTLLLFIIGLSIGSFLNVLIDRLPNGEQVFKGRSYCDNCRKTLKWYDLIPVVSFIILGRKCRYCHSPISYFYPLVEIITGILFLITFMYLKDLRFTIYDLRFFINYFYYLFIICSLIVVFFSDLKYGIIPDAIIYPAIAVALIYNLPLLRQGFGGQAFLNFQLSSFNFFLSGLGSFIFLLALFFITRGKGMGFGDVKLALLMGVFLNFPKIISAFYLAFLTGAIIGTILIVWGKKKLKGGTIPFGPFLVLGTLLSLFFGEKIIQIIWNGVSLR